MISIWRKTLKVEVAWKRLEGFLVSLCTQIGLDFDGAMPFTEGAIDWDVEQQEEED